MPSNDAAFLLFHDKLKREATAIGAGLGITADDLAEITADNTAAHQKVDAAVTANSAAKQSNKDKDNTLAAIKARVRKFAKRVLGHRDYTEEQGIQLGIVGMEDSTDMTVAQPVLVANPLPHGAVEVAFNKSKADGVNLYSQRDGDSGFVFLARDTSSPYVDNRPLLVPGKPEVRKYRGIYVVNDAEVGLTSDDVTAVCQP
jgi:antitoxin component of RelBE/YafQ-DinJ toxin-antitoxin module